MRKNAIDHWCQLCRGPIQSKPHIHCIKCQASPSAITTRIDGASRWLDDEIRYHTCNVCGYTWRQVAK